MKIVLTLLTVFCFQSALLAQVWKTDTITFYFDFGKAKAENLNWKGFLDNAHLKEYSINGFADTIGALDFNQKLSDKRAYFVASKIPKGSIIREIKGNGEKLHGSNERSRRVVIVSYMYVPKPPPQKVAKIEPIKKEQKNIDPVNKPATISLKKPSYALGNCKLSELTPGTRVSMRAYFEGGRHKLEAGSNKEVKKLLKELKANPNVRIEIQGHICCHSDNNKDGFDMDTRTYNLSENRAKFIHDYLIKNGIEANRLKYKGFKRLRPLKNNKDESRNRRVEIMIL